MANFVRATNGLVATGAPTAEQIGTAIIPQVGEGCVLTGLGFGSTVTSGGVGSAQIQRSLDSGATWTTLYTAPLYGAGFFDVEDGRGLVNDGLRQNVANVLQYRVIGLHPGHGGGASTYGVSARGRIEK